MRPRKYHVTLTAEEHSQLLELVKTGTSQAYKITHAQVLLKLDESFNDKPWSIKQISDAYLISDHTIVAIAQRFVEEGCQGALERKKQLNRHHKVTGDIQAQIIATACSDAPLGRERWTLRLLADHLVELGVVDSISTTSIATTLKKTNLSPGSIKNGASQNQEPNS